MSLHYALPIFDGTALAMTAKGTMARALDTGQMAFTMTARADDLKLVDAVIEAGLFGTQPVNLAAHVERDRKSTRLNSSHICASCMPSYACTKKYKQDKSQNIYISINTY